jgi:transcriptional regulator with XRE-family HTH domain
MSALNVDYLQIQEDVLRRRQLREFLMDCRSHVDPVEHGLPQTARRRVAGLRRGEVAELVGVTVDWYRSFESGRAVRVSPQFLARLSKALRLSATEQFALFRLALPEIYHLEISASVRGPAFFPPRRRRLVLTGFAPR